VWHSKCISLILAYNKGVAFSMFAFLAEYLKYIQTAVLLGLFSYLLYEKELLTKFSLPFGLIFGAGVSNIYDRFIHEGVVDYVYWHCYFDFAIFNFADVMINVGVGGILIVTFIEWRRGGDS
jgi:signal peptidase II